MKEQKTILSLTHNFVNSHSDHFKSTDAFKKWMLERLTYVLQRTVFFLRSARKHNTYLSFVWLPGACSCTSQKTPPQRGPNSFLRHHLFVQTPRQAKGQGKAVWRTFCRSKVKQTSKERKTQSPNAQEKCKMCFARDFSKTETLFV